MNDRPTILFVLPSGYAVDTAAGRRIVDNPTELPADGRPIALCVPSAWCLSASIDTTDVPRGDAKAMLYRLEENLPVAAEGVIADFITSDGSALGVCVRAEPLTTLVGQLEADGVLVQSILPTALAAAQKVAELVPAAATVMLIAEPASSPPQLNLVALVGGRPTHWLLVPATGPDLKLNLDLLSAELGSIPHIEAVGLDPALTDTLIESTSLLIEPRDVDCLDAAAALGAGVVAGRVKPWVEFRSGPLAVDDRWRTHRRPLNYALLAAVAVMLSLTAALFLRGHRYGRVEESARDQMIAAFRERFPSWDVPPNVRAVVDAQYRGMTAAADAASVDGHGSALSTLHDAVMPVTALGPLQVDRMSVHGDSFEITGRVSSADQIDALTQAARKSGMTVPPPQTRREADGRWSFTLQGNRTRGTP